MRHSNPGKTDPQQPEPAKRGFFAAAGERLKRAMSGARSPDVATASPPEAPNGAEGAGSEVTTSVQAKARELLQQDRTRRGSGESDADAVNGVHSRRTSPPPLPAQRTAAEQAGAPADAVGGETTARPSTARPKRPVRDSKSEALRARLGAAKAALAEAQAKRAAEQTSAAQLEDAKRESAAADGGSGDPALPSAAEAMSRSTAADGSRDPALPSAAEAMSSVTAADGSRDPALPSAAEAMSSVTAADGGSGDPALPSAAEAMSGNAHASQPTPAAAAEVAEPIRTLTIARLLARQGYFERSLSIYDQLLSENANDAELRAETERVRAQTGEQANREP